MDEDVVRQMTEAYYSTEIQSCLAVIESITGYKLSAADREPFLYFDTFITNSPPAFLATWRENPVLEKWYSRFKFRFLSELQNTFACVLYHHGRLKAIESAVIESIEKLNYRRVLGNGVLGIGNALVWDFEYQAFILAYRRCLDYLARAICTYFRNDCHSFRKLDVCLRKCKPESVARSIIPLHEKYSPLFAFVLSEGERKSIRDRISHYEYVHAGSINLSQRGLFLAGGGENIPVLRGKALLLSEILDGHVANLREALREIIYSFVDAIRAEESTHV